MRITYLHQYFNTLAQSGGTRSYELARRLVARGHQVTMITSDRIGGGGPVREEIIQGIRVLWIPVAYDNAMSYARRMAAFAAFALRSARLAASQECDVIYATSTPLTIAIPAMYAARRRRVPWVLEVRDLWPEIPVAMGALPNPVLRKIAFRLADSAYASASHVVALSPGMARGICKRGVNSSKVTVIPNGCDTKVFACSTNDGCVFRADHPELGDRRIVLYAGTAGQVNGLEYMVDLACAALPHQTEVVFVAIGHGGRSEAVRARAIEKGVLNANFFMYPPLPKSCIVKAFAAAELTMSLVIDNPALHDNSANKFFDSLSAGRPIAINHEGWLADMIREKSIGVVLPASNPAKAARELLKCLQDIEGLQAFGLAAQSLAEGEFSRERLFDALEQVLMDATQYPSADASH